ncbi:MAG: hypothetical protein AAGI01_14590, partial [Myxococcota bacterium]
AGQLLRVTIEAPKGPGAALTIEGVEDGSGAPIEFERRTPSFRLRSSARFVLIPQTGTYRMKIGPATAGLGGAFLPIGDPDWEYLGSIEHVHLPTPERRNAGFASTVTDYLQDNFFEVEADELGAVVVAEVKEFGDDIESAQIQVWSANFDMSGTFTGLDELLGTAELSEDPSNALPVGLPPSQNVIVVVDWESILGPSVDVAFELAPPGGFIDFGAVAPGGTTNPTKVVAPRQYAFTDEQRTWFISGIYEAGQFVTLSWTGDSFSDTLEKTEIFDPNGDPIHLPSLWEEQGKQMRPSSSSTPPREAYLTFYAPTTGRYTALVEDTSSSSSLARDVEWTVESFTPPTPQTLQIGDTASSMSSSGIAEWRSVFVTYNFPVDVSIEGLVSKGQGLQNNSNSSVDDMNLRVIHARTGEIALAITNQAPDQDIPATVLKAGTYHFEIEAVASLSDDGHLLGFEVREAPLREAEPNNVAAQATTWADTTREFEGVLAGPTDEDWISFTPPGAGATDTVTVLRARTQGQPTDEYSCRIEDPMDANNVVAFSGSATGACVLFAQDLAPARVYNYRIQGNNAASTPYTLSIESFEMATVEVELNNTSTTPFLIGALPAAGMTQTVFGEVGVSQMGGTSIADEDWHQFSVPMGLSANDDTIIEVEGVYNSSAVNFEIELLDPSGTTLRTDSDVSSSTITLSALPMGDYKLRISRALNDTQRERSGRYRVRISRATR